MEIRFTLSPKDMAAFHRAWARYQQGGAKRRRARWPLWVFGVLVAALAIYFVEDLAAFGLQDILIQLLGILIALAIGVVVWQSVVHRKLAQSVTGEIVMRLAEDGLHYDDLITRSVTRWDGIEHVEQGRDHIVAFLGYARGYVIPKRAFADEASLGEALATLRRFLPDQPIGAQGELVARSKRQHRRLAVAGLILAVVALIGATMPWRESLELPGGLGSMAFLETTTGAADPEATLPLIIDLHPLGGMPELTMISNRRRNFPARVVAPAAPQWHIFGRSWFSLGHHMVEDTHATAAQLAAFVRLVTERYPTAGRPIVTGFSQGGSMAFAMAAYYPELFAAAVPVAGALPDGVPEYEAPPGVTVRALHGADDQIVYADWADYTVSQMSEQGWDATLQVFPDSSHKLSPQAREAWIDLLATFAAAEAEKGAIQ